VVASFLTFGLFWGSWAVMLFYIQRTYSLNDAQLGVLLAVAVAVAGGSSAFTAHLADRVGARRLLWVALFAWSGLLCILPLTDSRWTFSIVLVPVMVAGGSIDTAMNAEASHRLVDHPSSLVQLHALFNTGALCGAAVAALLIHAGISWRWVWPGIAVIGAAVGVWALMTDTGTAMATAGTGTVSGDGVAAGIERSSHPVRRLRQDGLLILLAVFALAEVTEGGVDTWGVLYLRNHLATGVLLGAGAYVVGQLMAVTTRGAGGPLLGRLSSRHALIVGGCVAGSGILLESLTSLSWMAAVGLALGAGGASLFWPLVMSTVSRQATQVVSAVGTFTAAGYIGWVAGAPIVGWVSQTLGPAHGLQVLALASFGVAVCTLFLPSRKAAPGTSG
jgi:MFS family permease